MSEVIVDIDNAYFKKSDDPTIPANFDPILSEHGKALIERLREDKAQANEISSGKGLKASTLSELDSVLWNMNSNGPTTLLPTIRFRRTVDYTLDMARRTKAPLLNGETRTFVEPTTLVLLSSKFLTTLIKSGTLLEEIQKVRNALDVHHQIFVLIQGLNEDWKKDSLKKQRDYTASIRRALENQGSSSNPSMATSVPTGSGIGGDGELSKEKVETELMRLRIALRAFVINVNSKEDAADWVHSIACDVSIRTDKSVSTLCALLPSTLVSSSSELAYSLLSFLYLFPSFLLPGLSTLHIFRSVLTRPSNLAQLQGRLTSSCSSRS